MCVCEVHSGAVIAHQMWQDWARPQQPGPLPPRLLEGGLALLIKHGLLPPARWLGAGQGAAYPSFYLCAPPKFSIIKSLKIAFPPFPFTDHGEGFAFRQAEGEENRI